MNQKNVGNKIAQRRKEMGMTQSALAERLQVTNKAVSKWETGEGYPDITLIKKLSSILQISVDELLEDQESEQVVEVSLNRKNPHHMFRALVHLLIVMTFLLPFISFDLHMFDIMDLPGITITRTGFQLLISSPNNIQTFMLVIGLYVIVLASVIKVVYYVNSYAKNQGFFEFIVDQKVVLITQIISVLALVMLWITTLSQGVQIGLVLLSIIWAVSVVYEVGYKKMSSLVK